MVIIIMGTAVSVEDSMTTQTDHHSKVGKIYIKQNEAKLAW